jgi:hypothetical protein
MSPATWAGTLSTTVFVASMAPMLWRAARTRDLSSYSLGHLALTAAGNVVHTVYVLSLPPGPVWLLHATYLAVTTQMLVWKWQERGRRSRGGAGLVS